MELYTPAGKALSGTPWTAYPRPQMKREDWLCLNGEWELATPDGVTQRIRVPFCPESLLSGARGTAFVGKELRYRRVFRLPESWRGRRVLLHLGAVSRRCRVELNGATLAEHENGYLPFTVELTERLQSGENVLCVYALNDLSRRHAWGKQSAQRGGMWYTPVSGIWQTVWLEPVPTEYITALRIRTGLDWAEIETDGVKAGTVMLAGAAYPLENGRVRIPIAAPQLWTPETPTLYPFTLLAGEDRVESYFALRTLSCREINGKKRLCLNGEPIFFHALLDQGYWSDGLYTPPMPESYAEDILAAKRLGFNTLRKHIKIEPEQFYYDCDRLGMIVFQDMVNHGRYHYVGDTVLPTLHFQRRRDRLRHRDRAMRANFLAAMEETVRLLQNHPCICYWTIFNEGWGQFCADDAYEKLRALDDSRFIDATSGWFHQKKSDVDSLHIYFDKLHLGRKPLPQVLSEFGGFVWKLPEHSFNTEKTYGYRKFDDRAAFVAGLRALYMEEVVPLAEQGLCAAVYTQLSDVEDETNGLVTFDRACEKLAPEELADIAAALERAVRE